MAVYAEIDGQLYEFPDGTTPEEMATALEGLSQPAQPAAPNAPAAAAPAAPQAGPQVPLAGLEDVLTQDQYATYQQSGFDPASVGQAPVERAPVPLGDTVLDVASGGADGLLQGVANVLGAPVDLTNAAIGGVASLFGADLHADMPVGGSENIGSLLRAPSNLYNAYSSDTEFDPLGRYDPTTTPGRYANRIGEEVGAAATTLGIPLGRALGAAAGAGGREAALQAVRSAPQARGPVQGLIRDAEEALLTAPSKVGLREAAYATGAGAGAQAATDMYGDSPWADLIGSLLGAGGVSVAGGLKNVVSDLGAAIFGDGGDTAKRVVAETLLENTGLQPEQLANVNTQPLVDALTARTDVEDAIPGVQMTTADKLRSEPLRALEYKRGTSPEFSQLRARNEDAVNDALSGLEPKGQASTFRQGLEEGRDRVVSEATERADTASADADSLFEALSPTTSQETRGAQIRGGVERALAGARQQEDEAWRAVSGEIDASGLREVFQEVGEGMDPVLREKFDPLSIPGVRDVIGEAAEEIDPDEAAMMRALGVETAERSGPQPVKNVTAISSALSTELRKASMETAETFDAQRAKAIAQYKAALDDYLDENFVGDKDAYDNAKRVTAELNQNFTRTSTDPVAQSIDRSGSNYRKSDAAVPDLFVTEDRRGSKPVRDLLDRTGDDPEVRGALDDQLRDQLTRGGSSSRALEARSGRFAETFDLFPDTGAQAQQATDARRAAEGAGDELKSILREFGDGNSSPGRNEVAKYLRHSDDNASKAMEKVINSPNPEKAMDELLSFVGDEPAVVEGARKAYWELMEKRARGQMSGSGVGNEEVWQSRKWSAFLEQGQSGVERLYRDNPEHLDNLKKIAEAYSQVDTARTARPANSSGTAAQIQGNGPELSLATLQSRYIDVARGRMSPLYFITNTVSTLARKYRAKGLQEAMDGALNQALVDPEVAAKLLKDYNPRDLRAAETDLKSLFGNRASMVAEAMDETLREEEESGK